MVFADINEETAAANAEKSKAYASNKAYKALSFKVDVTDPVSVQAMVDFTVQNFGRIDYSVNSAGVGSSPSILLESLLRTEYRLFIHVLTRESSWVLLL